MALPRPASPRALLADLRALVTARGPHRIIAALLALLIPGILFTAIFVQHGAYKSPERTVYVQMYSANRTDAEIIADQRKAQAEKEAQAKEKQRQYRKLADMLGIDVE